MFQHVPICVRSRTGVQFCTAYQQNAWCRASSQFQQLHRIGSGHASIVHLVWDKAANTHMAVKCYKSAAQHPDIARQVCQSQSV